jgi:hypothetical protein
MWLSMYNIHLLQCSLHLGTVSQLVARVELLACVLIHASVITFVSRIMYHLPYMQCYHFATNKYFGLYNII